MKAAWDPNCHVLIFMLFFFTFLNLWLSFLEWLKISLLNYEIDAVLALLLLFHSIVLWYECNAWVWFALDLAIPYNQRLRYYFLWGKSASFDIIFFVRSHDLVCVLEVSHKVTLYMLIITLGPDKQKVKAHVCSLQVIRFGTGSVL